MKRVAAKPRLAVFPLLVGLVAGCTNHQMPDAAASTAANFNVGICVNEECGLVDQDASVLIPFAKDAAVTGFPMQETMLEADTKGWRLLDRNSRKEIKRVGTGIYDAIPNYFGFVRDGKVGLMNFKGVEIQPPRFDVIYSGGQDQYIGFEIDGKRGMLKADGSLLANAEFDSAEVNYDFDQHGGWVLADKGDKHWIINLGTGAKQSLERRPYGGFVEFQDRDEPDRSARQSASAQAVRVVRHAWQRTDRLSQ
jgi:hypothetical protein